MDRRTVLAIAIATATCVACPAVAAKPLPSAPMAALILGFDYTRADGRYRLQNARRDAELVGQTLKGMRAASLTMLLDPDVASLPGSLAEFRRNAAKTGLGVVYFSGHGVQIDGMNYLLSADGASLIELESLIRYLREGVRTLVVFVDACRNNPFAGQDKAAKATAPSRSVYILRDVAAKSAIGDFAVQRMGEGKQVGNGLARFDLEGAGLKIIFATDPNNVAYDSMEADQVNGPFATALSRRLGARQSLDMVLAEVTKDVRVLTGGQQTPWQQGALEQVIFLAGQPARYGDGTRDNMPTP